VPTWRCSTAPGSGKAIAAHAGDIEAAVAAYEAAMFPRSVLEAADAHLTPELCLGDRAPLGLVEFFTGVREGRADVPNDLSACDRYTH
jgi:hypothetical protein